MSDSLSHGLPDPDLNKVRAPRRTVSVLALAIALSGGFATALSSATAQEATTAPALSAPATSAPAASEPADYAPESGQPGKDVVWVPTPQVVVDQMLAMAEVTAQDRVLDLGSGDGRLVITAAQRGATAHGIEYNPDLVKLSRRNAEAAGVTERATFEEADLFAKQIPKAEVVTLFLLPSLNEKLRPQLLDFEPGTRVVSNTFLMGDWEPDESAKIGENCTQWCTAHLWIVPAKVGGTWQLGEEQLQLDQKHQVLTGKLGSAEIENGKVKGTQVTFTVDGVTYTGELADGEITGTATGGDAATWTAKRG